LKEYNQEREADTLAHWYNKEPSPLMIGVSGNKGRYNVRLGKKRSFITVGMVADHDVNIKKEVFPQVLPDSKY